MLIRVPCILSSLGAISNYSAFAPPAGSRKLKVMVIFLHSHSYLLAGYPQGSYSHGHRLALPGPARDHARKAPSMAAGGDDQKLVRIFDQAHRSEEHTSELQSLMRISYAVFCLKKKKHE